MSRLLAATVLALVLSLAAAAPVPREADKPVVYFPTKPGATWVYREGDREFTQRIVKVEDRGGTKVVRVERARRGEAPAPWMVVEVGPRGLVQTHVFADRLDPPQRLLPHPVKPGDRWNLYFYEGREGALRVDVTAAQAEPITVPAGTFSTVRVDAAYDGPRGKETSSRWYAAGIGEVQKTSDGKTERVLVSFSRGKD
jgi:hypothetical protein